MPKKPSGEKPKDVTGKPLGEKELKKVVGGYANIVTKSSKFDCTCKDCVGSIGKNDYNGNADPAP
jgi:hypothetical protein